MWIREKNRLFNSIRQQKKRRWRAFKEAKTYDESVQQAQLKRTNTHLEQRRQGKKVKLIGLNRQNTRRSVLAQMKKTSIEVFHPVVSNDFNEQEKMRCRLSIDEMTELEKRYSWLTVKRTLVVFFLVLFSVPFWIPTTYKPYASEYQPFLKMFDSIKETNATLSLELQKKFVAQESDTDDRFQPIVKFKSDLYSFEEDLDKYSNLALY